MSGPPSGPPAGPPASLLSGPPAGPPASLLSGPPAGPPSGPPAGPPASLPFTPKEKPKRDLFAALGSPKLVETPNLSESSALQSNVVNPPLELTTVVDENKNDFQIQEIDEPSLIEEVSANVETDEIPETRKVISADGGDDWFDAFEPEPEPEEAKRVVKYADSIEWY